MICIIQDVGKKLLMSKLLNLNYKGINMTKFFMVLFFLIATIGCTPGSQEPLIGKVITEKASPGLRYYYLFAEDGTFIEVGFPQFTKTEVGEKYYSRRWQKIIYE